MFVPVYLAALAAAFFYALLPVVGAFVTRQQWRLFRKAVAEAAALPELSAAIPGSPVTRLGRFRARGEVDAIGGQHELWITCHDTACVIDLRGSWVYLLTGHSGDEKIERRRWKELPSIGPGARAFVAGSAALVGGRIVIGASGRDGEAFGLVGPPRE